LDQDEYVKMTKQVLQREAARAKEFQKNNQPLEYKVPSKPPPPRALVLVLIVRV